MAPKETSGNGSSRVRVVRYMECQCNHAASHSSTSSATITPLLGRCLAFAKLTANPEICANCGCNRSFHRKEVHRAAKGHGALLRLATLAAAEAETRPQTPRLPPQPAPATQETLPPLPPPPCREDDKLKPPKKRKLSLEAWKNPVEA